jgi:hypothetical protein
MRQEVWRRILLLLILFSVSSSILLYSQTTPAPIAITTADLSGGSLPHF